MLDRYICEKVEEKGLAIMAHIVCGYPSFEANWQILEEMEAAGVDVVEMQFPFSEPIADGPLFLVANQDSIDQGTKVKECLELMKRASEKFSFKILMMGYYNTVFMYGEELFIKKLQDCGAVGLIVPDLPLEEATPLLAICDTYKMAFIPLVAPTNTEERIKEVVEGARGFVYAVARVGVTGTKTKFTPESEAYLKFIKETSAVPLAVGFGISEKSDLEYLKGKADIAVIGTAVLKAYINNGREGVKTFFQSLK